jgi:protein TonB
VPSASITDPGATSFGWRLANLLAIASPYAVAAALFLVLYLSRTPAPPSFEASEAAAPAASAGGASVPVEAENTGTAAAAATPSEPAPQPLTVPHAKQAKPAAPIHPPAVELQTSSHNAVRGQPVHVDPAIAATMKLAGAPPAYPAIARAAGVEGTVVVALTIGPRGSVLDAHAVSGPPLLQPGTVFAVRSWRYRPWLAYGNAVPFETEISIHFEINSPSSGR